MASASSFDIVSKIEMPEVTNAIDQAMKEIKQRYDFKGSKSTITLDEKANTITVISDDEFKIKAVMEILQIKLAKRGVPLKNLIYGKEESAAGGTIKQVIELQQGISTEKGKLIVKNIKDSKLKVQASIQEDKVRVSGKKKDDLQGIMSMLKGKDLGVSLQFINYR